MSNAIIINFDGSSYDGSFYPDTSDDTFEYTGTVTIDWGDDTVETYTGGVLEHQYANNGTYEITVTGNVTAIKWYGLSYTGITSITIPSSVTNLGDSCFSSNPLTSITFESSTPPTIGESIVWNNDDTITVNVPSGSLSAYQSALNNKTSTLNFVEYTPQSDDTPQSEDIHNITFGNKEIVGMTIGNKEVTSIEINGETIYSNETPTPKGHPVTIRVVDEGTPIQNATVTVEGQTKTTTTQGIATFDLQLGNHNVTVSHIGGEYNEVISVVDNVVVYEIDINGTPL